MPTSRNRIIVPALLLLLLAVVIAGLLVGGRDTPDGGAAPEPSASATVGGGGDVGAAPSADSPGSPAPEDAEAPDLLRRIEGDPMAAGPHDAPVGVVVYSDFSCPYCRQWAQETQPALLDYAAEGRVRIEWRDVSILGEDSTRAAMAAAAAAQQGRYTEYQELLFADMDARSPEQLTALAEQVGLDVEQFTTDLDAPEVVSVVRGNMQEAQAVSLQSTPSFIVDGTPVVGAQPTEVFVELIESALAGAT
ncbi:DsbA family protein [Georgenia sp. H159]|uniref:DsbA family protein n=1 Tax=Georgenia sp. H159 TaxID=3076115 RepID=UPI002D7A2258|nr:thioredoxin domain-containing protein [Georgenia sp. H159]